MDGGFVEARVHLWSCSFVMGGRKHGVERGTADALRRQPPLPCRERTFERHGRYRLALNRLSGRVLRGELRRRRAVAGTVTASVFLLQSLKFIFGDPLKLEREAHRRGVQSAKERGRR